MPKNMFQRPPHITQHSFGKKDAKAPVTGGGKLPRTDANKPAPDSLLGKLLAKQDIKH